MCESKPFIPLSGLLAISWTLCRRCFQLVCESGCEADVACVILPRIINKVSSRHHVPRQDSQLQHVSAGGVLVRSHPTGPYREGISTVCTHAVSLYTSIGGLCSHSRIQHSHHNNYS